MIRPDELPAWPPDDPLIRPYVESALADGSWGAYHTPWHDRLLAYLANWLGQPHGRLCSSGTIAVELALRAGGIGSDDEVLLAGYDFPGNFRAIEQVGARPVLVDVAPRRWTVSVETLQSGWSPQVRAAIVSHLHGDLAPMPSIRAWADAQGIFLIEDACQVPGARIGDEPAGSFGDAAVLSFGGSKLLSAGRGGAVLCRDAASLQRIKVFADRGNDAFPMSALQAAVVLAQLEGEGFGRRHAQRLRGMQRLRERLGAGGPLRPSAADDRDTAFYKAGFFFDPSTAGGRSRDTYVTALRRAGLPIGTGFRGFLRRSARRCRRVGDLPACAGAVESTVLLDQRVLLASEPVLDRVASLLAAP